MHPALSTQHRFTDKKTVLVIGDPMVDVYHQTTTNRVSPEAPVLILREEREPTPQPGGAASTAWHFQHLDTEAFLVAPLDPQARDLLDTYVNTSHSMMLPTGSTPRKHRFQAEGRLIFRLDSEQGDYGEPCPSALRRELLNLVRYALDHLEPDAVVISDYAKGLFDPTTAQALTQEVTSRILPLLVDTKSRDADIWHGCTLLKLNHTEAANLTGNTDPRTAATHLRKQLDCDAVVITRAALPPIVTTRKHLNEIQQTSDISVSSTEGAGDCFLAHYTAAFIRGATHLESTIYAHEAARTHVTQPRNRPVHPRQTLRRLDPATAKITTLKDLNLELANHRHRRIILTSGVFDCLHAAHVHTINWAKTQGDILVVATNSDRSAKAAKGPTRPVVTENQRAAMLAALASTDHVLIFDEESPEALIKALRPTAIVKGADYKPHQVLGHELVSETLIAPPPPHDTHTTTIINRILTISQAS